MEGFQATLYPCELPWEGGWQELVSRVEAGEFLSHANAEDLLATPEPPEGRWYSVIADTPHEALAHVRDHEPLLDQDSMATVEGCAECFVDVQGRFATTAEALRHTRSA